MDNIAINVINEVARDIHRHNKEAGWWNNKQGEYDPASIDTGNKLMLCVSELAEAMEGDRKDLMDDKLPHRKMLEVELADAIIRIFDLAAAKGCDQGNAIKEKRAFNAIRPDHKIENRLKPGGKKY